MKRNYRVIRGATGPRGMPGQSAYGLWLQEGNQGNIHQFFSSIGGSRDVLYLHDGGQYVGSCKMVQMQNIAGKFKPGRYVIQFMLRADQGVFALYYDAIEVSHTRYQANGVLHGLGVIHVLSDTNMVYIKNISPTLAYLDGEDGCVDAFLWARPID